MMWGWNRIDGQVHLRGVICVSEKFRGTSAQNTGGASKVNCVKTRQVLVHRVGGKTGYEKRGRRRRRRDHEVGTDMEGPQERGPAEGRTVFRTSKRQAGGGRRGVFGSVKMWEKVG